MFLSEAAASGPTFFYLVPLVVFIPLIGLLINVIFGKWMGEKSIGWISVLHKVVCREGLGLGWLFRMI